MLDRQRLSAEHSELVTLAEALVAFVALPEPALESIAQVRWQLTRKLLAHLATEDTLLYPRLIAGTDRRAAAVATRFADEMGDLATSYRAYVTHWTAERMVAQWAAFGTETRKVMKALEHRIAQEETTLYPLIAASGAQRTVA